MSATGHPGGGSVTPPPDEIESLVRALISMMRGGGMTELDLTFGDVTVRLRGVASGTPAATISDLVEEPVAAAAGSPDYAIAAPMIGTFYASPSPGSPPFVKVGDAIQAGQTIGIIEAMKIMNEIPADRGGVVTEVVAANGQPVEYGSPLIRLRA